MESDLSTPTWKQLKNMDQKYVDHRATLFKHYIIISGGTNHSINSSAPTKNIYIYDIEKNIGYIKRPTGDIFDPRSNHSACLYQNDKIVLFGGLMSSSNQTNLSISDEIGILTLKEEKNLELEWKVLKCESKLKLKRAHHIAHIYQNKMYVFGGQSDLTLVGDNYLWCLNLDTLEWSQVFPSGLEPRGRIGATSVIVNNRIYLFGGKTVDTKLTEIWILNLGNLQWSEVSQKNLDQTSTFYASAQERDGNIYIFGGAHDKTHALTTQVYNIGTNTMQRLLLGALPPLNERSKHSLVCYKNMLIVFGGTSVDQGVDNTTYALELPLLTNINKRKIETQSTLLKEMLESKAFADIIFQVNGNEIKAHKSVLAIRCKHFADMLRSEPNTTKITIEDVQLPTFEALLQFIYCDEVPLYKELAIDLLKLSNKYIFEELKSVCEEYLMKNITLENFVELIELTEQLEAATLRKTLITFVAQNVDKIKLKENPSMLPSSVLWEIFSFLA